jgi:hypothetical protein
MGAGFEESIRRPSSVKIAVRAANSAIRMRDWSLYGAYKLPYWTSFGVGVEAM